MSDLFLKSNVILTRVQVQPRPQGLMTNQFLMYFSEKPSTTEDAELTTGIHTLPFI